MGKKETTEFEKYLVEVFEEVESKYGDEVARVHLFSAFFAISKTDPQMKCATCARLYDMLPRIDFECGENNEDCGDLYSKFDYRKHYSAYLKTPRWRRKRREILKKHGFRCELCGSGTNLNVHHITYENLPDECDDDLLSVCKRCHDKIHEADVKSKGEC